jgi:hypothetical protein
MGVTYGIAKLLQQDVPGASGAMVELGRQSVTFPRSQWRKLVPTVPSGTEGMYSDEFYKSLGFGTVDTIDISDFEGANIIQDMNLPIERADVLGKYELVFDCGTMEHVFHVPNFLDNLRRLCRVGGRVVHAVPCSNWIDHGFYMFSPTLFFDFYTANGFAMKRVLVVRFSSEQISYLDVTAMKSALTPELFLDGHTYVLYCCVEKLADNPAMIIPQQGGYVRLWRAAAVPLAGSTYIDRVSASAGETMIKQLLRSMRLYLFARKIYHLIRSRKAKRALNWKSA